MKYHRKHSQPSAFFRPRSAIFATFNVDLFKVQAVGRLTRYNVLGLMVLMVCVTSYACYHCENNPV